MLRVPAKCDQSLSIIVTFSSLNRSDTVYAGWKLLTRLHLHVKTRPVRATRGSLREIEWVVAISWQFRGQRGLYGGLRGCYGVYVPLFWSVVVESPPPEAKTESESPPSESKSEYESPPSESEPPP